MVEAVSNSSQSRRAFALLDLIVLLGVLVLLGWIFLPKCISREPAAASRCLMNQRQLTLSYLLYANDNQDILAPTSLQGIDFHVGGFCGAPQTGITKGISVDEALRRIKVGISNGVLWRYSPDYDTYHCPDDLRSKLNEPGAGWGYDSYSKMDGMAGGGWVGTSPLRKLTQVPEPAFAITFLEEADPRGYNLGTWVMNTSSTSSGWVDGLAVNHSGSSTASFADGHAELHKWQDPRTIRTAELMSRGIASYYASGGDSSNPDFLWVERRYKYDRWEPRQP